MKMEKTIKRIIDVLTDIDGNFAKRPMAEQIKDAKLIRGIYDRSPCHSIERALAIIEGEAK
jgi:hypothetical protein